jgi:SAM-dependent methyltransferase
LGICFPILALHRPSFYLPFAAFSPPIEKLKCPSHRKGSQAVVLPGFFKGTEMPTAGWWEALWPDPATVLNQVGIRAGMTVIDLCCGDGWFTLQIAKIASRVVAVDIDAKLLDVAKLRLAESGLTNSNFVEGNAYDVAKVVPQPADFVFLANAFHGVPEQTRLARAVADALKSGGKFAIVNWHARPREETTILGEPRGPATELRISPETTIAAVEPAGFKPVRIVELPPYHYGALFRKP